MHIFQTEGVPPNIGRIIFANIGSIQNINVELMNKEKANNIKANNNKAVAPLS